LPLEAVEVADRPDVDLRAGKKGANADIDGEAALDPLDDSSLDDGAVLVGLFDLIRTFPLRARG
jgi:hypothetical protein